MFLNEIIAVRKKPGLFRVVAMLKEGIVAESLKDGKRIPLTGDAKSITVIFRSSVFLKDGGKLPMRELFKMMGAHGSPPDAGADDKTLQDYFKAACPQHDEERLHPSHMHKIVKWYLEIKTKADFNKSSGADNAAA